LKGKTVLEIGCGKGEFLTLLCEMGGNRGIGFDPAYVEERDHHSKDIRIEFIKDFYSEKYAHYKADFICCKMTLEHIHPVAEFVTMVRRAIGDNPNSIVFFQIPDVTRILSDIAFEDIYYEHCSYFSNISLSMLFKASGFVVDSVQTDYGGQYLMIEGRPSNGENTLQSSSPAELADVKMLVDTFPSRFEEKVSHWHKRFSRFRSDGKRVVLWGSGSKAVSFLTTLELVDEVKFVVDINPYRQDTYMAGTGQKIVSPEFLNDYRPDVVVIMNEVYKKEITRNLSEFGLAPEILTL
jgi:SAM-dependent methyltransferase